MTKGDIKDEFKRVTRRWTGKKDMPVPEKEIGMVKRAERITRRQRASHVIGGETNSGKKYILLKFRNNMV